MGLISPGGENLLDFLEMRQGELGYLETDIYIRDIKQDFSSSITYHFIRKDILITIS